MIRIKIHRSAIILSIAVCVFALFASGCCSRRLESLERENRALNQRIIELETLLEKKNAAASAPTPVLQPQVSQSIYIVVEGDTLWSIAKKRLGSGTRYKEILALNPQISKDQQLAIGTRLIIPAK